MKVTIFHNEDAGFFRSYEPGDTLTKVHEVEMAPADPMAILNYIYEQANIGEGEFAQAYRGVKIVNGVQVDDGQGKAIVGSDGRVYGIRSLSVGDVIVLDGTAYTVASFGFDEVTLEGAPA